MTALSNQPLVELRGIYYIRSHFHYLCTRAIKGTDHLSIDTMTFDMAQFKHFSIVRFSPIS